MKLLEGLKNAELKLGRNFVVAGQNFVFGKLNFLIVVGLKLLDKKRLLNHIGRLT